MKKVPRPTKILRQLARRRASISDLTEEECCRLMAWQLKQINVWQTNLWRTYRTLLESVVGGDPPPKPPPWPPRLWRTLFKSAGEDPVPPPPPWPPK